MIIQWTYGAIDQTAGYFSVQNYSISLPSIPVITFSLGKVLNAGGGEFLETKKSKAHDPD
ncbi:MAG TPA: hypothetical protein VJ044_00990 [Candidatus Hodarchaeales archaeon]|nr:hypothetical protein [Candidatus Hodarchaeales archaeon]